MILFFSVVLNSIGQILFKAARTSHPDASLISLFTQLDTLEGLILYGLSAICWLWVLSRAQLSYAYPILSISFPVVMILSAVIFSESISPLRWFGVMVIVVGVSLLART
jgi:multidrug transporter EmrE-like cation transporter